MKTLICMLTILVLLFIYSGLRAEDWYFYYSTPHSSYYPYYTYGYNPYYDWIGSYEYGAGVHTRGYSSPYRHGTHHGYHYNPESGWHGGSHYGHW